MITRILVRPLGFTTLHPSAGGSHVLSVHSLSTCFYSMIGLRNTRSWAVVYWTTRVKGRTFLTKLNEGTTQASPERALTVPVVGDRSSCCQLRGVPLLRTVLLTSLCVTLPSKQATQKVTPPRSHSPLRVAIGVILFCAQPFNSYCTALPRQIHTTKPEWYQHAEVVCVSHYRGKKIKSNC